MNFFKNFSQLNEGAWSIPDTVFKVKKLKELLSSTLLAKDYMKMYNVIGDDALFDSFYDFKLTEDIRPIILEWLVGFVRRYENNIKKNDQNFNFNIEPSVLEMLKSILHSHNINPETPSRFFDRILKI